MIKTNKSQRLRFNKKRNLTDRKVSVIVDRKKQRQVNIAAKVLIQKSTNIILLDKKYHIIIWSYNLRHSQPGR